MPIISHFQSGGATATGTYLLDPVSSIEYMAGTQTAYIKWTDPEDLTLDDGQSIAKWAGTLLVRKAGAPVQGRQDGNIVMDLKSRSAYSSVWLQDTGLTDGITYYYQFFPYTTGGSYTFDYSNAFELTPGTVLLDGVTKLTAENAGNRKINLTWTDPAATIEENGITLAKWSSTKVVYKAGSYPTSSTDGTMAANVMSYNAHASTPLVVTVPENDVEYYFALFPTTVGGIETVDANSRVKCTAAYYRAPDYVSSASKLVYNGNQLSPEWIGYDSSIMTKTGDEYGVAAGEYTTTFTLHEDYCWPDGSIKPQVYRWTIETKKTTVPEMVSETLVYTGTSIAPNWLNFDPEDVVIGGDTSGIDAGLYSTTFELMENREWDVGGFETVTIHWEIEKATVFKPSVQGSMIYTGEEQSPDWSNLDASKVDIVGDTAATAAGDYNTTFTPKKNYMWEDGTTTAHTVWWSIEKAGVSKPSVNGSFIYNGEEQRAVISGYDETGSVMTGDFAATNVGEYSLTAMLRENYMWSDGTTNALVFWWSISPATSEWMQTAGGAAWALTAEEPAKSFMMLASSAVDGAEAYAYAENPDIVTVSYMQPEVMDGVAQATTVTLTGAKNGSTIIHYGYYETNNYTAVGELTLAVSVDLTVRPRIYTEAKSGIEYEDGIHDIDVGLLSEWSEAIAASEDITGDASELWLHYGTTYRHISAGDPVVIKLDGTEYVFNLLGFNQDELSGEDGFAGMTFEMDEVLPDTYRMNTSMTNVGGYEQSNLRTVSMVSIKAKLPESWLAVIKPVKKRSDSGGGDSASVVETTEDVFILSEEELFGKASYGHSSGDMQYAYYRAGNSTIKSTGGTAQRRYTRTSRDGNSYGFVGVKADGTAAQVSANVQAYVAIALCI